MATKKETRNPRISIGIWEAENPEALFNRSYPVAAAMVGTANKKENSTIASLLIPMSNPPTIVAPDRETPGISASDYHTPIKKDFL